MVRSNCIRGFTLKELVVVLASIALLIAVLVPSLSHATELYRHVSCLSRMAQISTALSMYSQDYSGLIASSGYPYGRVYDSGGSGGVWPSWSALLVTHPDEAWEMDPDYNPSGTPWGPPVDYLDSPELLQCPQDPADPNTWVQNINGSYGINSYMGYNDPVNPGQFYDLSATKVPEQMYLMFCNLNDGGGTYHDQVHAIVKNFTDFSANRVRAWTPALRHPYGQATHVMYHDGSVRSLGWQDIRTYNGSLSYAGDEVIVRGPWLNGTDGSAPPTPQGDTGFTDFHDIPAWALSSIMSLPGHGQVTNPLPGDTSGDDTVDIVDLNMLLIDWGNTGLAITDQRADTNSDDTVDIIDLNTILIDWGKTN